MNEALRVYFRRGADPVLVGDGDALDAVLDRVHADSLDVRVPSLVEIVTADERRALDIGLGQAEYSVLIWHDDEADEVLASRGTVAVGVDAGFDFAGTWTRLPANSAITMEVARTAAREFAASGLRPTTLAWQLPMYA